MSTWGLKGFVSATDASRRPGAQRIRLRAWMGYGYRRGWPLVHPRPTLPPEPRPHQDRHGVRLPQPRQDAVYAPLTVET